MESIRSIYLVSDNEEDLTSVSGLMDLRGWESYLNTVGGPSKVFFTKFTLPDTRSFEDFIESLEHVLLPLGLGFTNPYRPSARNKTSLVIIRLEDKEGN